MNIEQYTKHLYAKFTQHKDGVIDDESTKKIVSLVLEELKALMINWGHEGEEVEFYDNCRVFLNTL